MGKNTYKFWVFSVAMMLLATRTAFAQAYVQAVSDFDSLMREYNLVSLGNASISGNDTWGGLAVGGNLTLNSVPVANLSSVSNTGSDPTLYVAGQLILNGDSQLNNGYAAISSAANSGYTLSGNQFVGSNGKLILNSNASNPLTNAGPANWNWSTIGSQALSISQTLAAANQSGTVAVNTSNQTLTFSSNSTDSGVVVFNLDASLLGSGTFGGQNFSNIGFSLAANQTAVVNVSNAAGRTIFGNGNMNLSSDIASRLLWNITDTSGSVSLGNGGQFYGSVLAPLVNVSNYNSPVNGQVLAGSLTYSGAELHDTPFTPVGITTGVLVPEPSTYALWGVGLCAAGFVLRRRLQAVRR